MIFGFGRFPLWKKKKSIVAVLTYIRQTQNGTSSTRYDSIRDSTIDDRINLENPKTAILVELAFWNSDRESALFFWEQHGRERETHRNESRWETVLAPNLGRIRIPPFSELTTLMRTNVSADQTPTRLPRNPTRRDGPRQGKSLKQD